MFYSWSGHTFLWQVMERPLWGVVLHTPELPTKEGLQSCTWWVRVPW